MNAGRHGTSLSGPSAGPAELQCNLRLDLATLCRMGDYSFIGQSEDFSQQLLKLILWQNIIQPWYHGMPQSSDMLLKRLLGSSTRACILIASLHLQCGRFVQSLLGRHFLRSNCCPVSELYKRSLMGARAKSVPATVRGVKC